MADTILRYTRSAILTTRLHHCRRATSPCAWVAQRRSGCRVDLRDVGQHHIVLRGLVGVGSGRPIRSLDHCSAPTHGGSCQPWLSGSALNMPPRSGLACRHRIPPTRWEGVVADRRRGVPSCDDPGLALVGIPAPASCDWSGSDRRSLQRHRDDRGPYLVTGEVSRLATKSHRSDRVPPAETGVA